MLPPAPARFSTMIVRLAIGRSCSAKKRTSTSAPLPGGNAQMKRMSRFGYCCATAACGCARAVTSVSASAAGRQKRCSVGVIIRSSQRVLKTFVNCGSLRGRRRLFLECLLPRLAELWHYDERDRDRGHRQQHSRDRAVDEDH